jgi:acetyl esterase/lipase
MTIDSKNPPGILLSATNAIDQSFAFVHLPPAEKRNGTAVIVCPGGGYGPLTMASEGHDTAKWLVERGVAGIVLQYRLPGRKGNSHCTPLEDAQAAIRLVRRRAAEWGIDPQRVGILGYSAGGQTISGSWPDRAAEWMKQRGLLNPMITMLRPQFTHMGDGRFAQYER